MVTMNETWLHGKYIINNHKVEINVNIPYFAIDGAGIDYFVQGDSAQENITEMHAYWLANDCSVEDTIQWFINTYLY